MKKKYTAKDDAMISEMYSAGFSNKAIAKKVKRSVYSLRYRLYRVLCNVRYLDSIKYV